MLLSPHREALLSGEPDFSKRRAGDLPPCRPVEAEGDERIQRTTAESFGAQWKTFRQMQKDYGPLFDAYFDGIDVAQFRGREVLDAGCGMARWAVFWARAGAEVFAVDLGSAVESAAVNLREYSNAHVVQADLLRLPFEAGTFPAVYSMGVLHHLPSPESGFRAVAAQVASGGTLGVYLYYSLENRSAFHRTLLGAARQFRRVTVRLPYPALKGLGGCLAVLFTASLVGPARVLHALGFRRAASAVPLSQYAPLEFRVLYTDMVDRFGAPLEHRFSRAQVRGFYERAGFPAAAISEAPPYWHAWGRRPAASPGEQSPRG